jgi:hypothetical protein
MLLSTARGIPVIKIDIAFRADSSPPQIGDFSAHTHKTIVVQQTAVPQLTLPFVFTLYYGFYLFPEIPYAIFYC